jgi:hypothetical protein
MSYTIYHTFLYTWKLKQMKKGVTVSDIDIMLSRLVEVQPTMTDIVIITSDLYSITII